MGSPAGRLPRAWRITAWLGAALFAVSLGYFLYTYVFTFGESQQPPPALAAILWNLGLFTLFALHHSLFAREHVRAWVARTVPPPLERSIYVWIASLLFILVCAGWQPVGGIAWSFAGPAGWSIYAMLVTGVWLSLRSATAIDAWELAGVRQVQPNPAASGPVFRATGPYGFVRHPIYLGWFLMVFGVPVMTGTRLVFAVVSCSYLLAAIPLEERTLRRTTAGKYEEYMRKVRWRLLPGVY